MKNSIFKEKFKETNFVRPLYKVKFTKKPVFTNINKVNLVGDDLNVNLSDKYANVKFKEIEKCKTLPGGCEVSYDVKYDLSDTFKRMPQEAVHKESKSQDNFGNSRVAKKIVLNKFGAIDEEIITVPETWLRVFPAPMYPGEPASSVAFRCICCQLGLTAILVLWTLIWVFIIQSFEGPHEDEVTQEFAKEQNQLVIDLATELRQITPLSMKWRDAIIRRIDESRQLTMRAAGRGAKLNPGEYWGLSGTFLFTVYVMTALGFGAPVPQTVCGRTLSLVFAVIAVPTHVYLMMNASTCAVAHINYGLAQWKKSLKTPDLMKTREGPIINNSPNCSTNFDGKTSRRRRRLHHFVCIITAGHCIPLVSVIYYILGVLIFGLARHMDLVEVFLFPLQFTTGGVLSSMEDHYRILYGFYVEGAMALLTCLLATLRRNSGNSVNEMTVKYRLFTRDKHGSW